MKRVFIFLFIVSLAGVVVFISCRKEPINKVPVPKAGVDQVITLPTDSISLDGSASNDPDGTISEWLWKKIAGPASFAIINSTSAKTVVKDLDAGIYQFELKVTDNGGLSANDTLQILVVDTTQPNRPPVAEAGADQTIRLPADSIMLDGSGSTDPDNNIISYLWTKTSGPSSSIVANAAEMQTQITGLVEGVYQFELKLTDEGGLLSKDTVQINVTPAVNRLPNADAGPDQAIALPTNSTILDGNGSTDPDNNITNYEWSKISGPDSFSIANANLAKTQINNLTEAIYQFELKVTDAGGLFSRDTLSIRVNHHPESGCDISDWPVVQLSLTEIGRLSEPRIPEVGVAGGKIVFAGGAKDLVCSWEWEISSSAVDIYDINSKVWTTARLSKERSNIAVVSRGNKIFFAGGRNWENVGGGATQNVSYSNIDIYDVATNVWSVEHLSKAREGISAVTIGSKIFFAGGSFFTGHTYPGFISNVTNIIDIYDVSTGGWSIVRLSVPRANSVNVIKGDSVYFVGGWGSSTAARAIDVYVSSTNSWSAFTWSEEEISRFFTSAGLLGGPATKLCGCGTSVNGNSIQIGFFNTVTNRCTIGILPQYPPGLNEVSDIVVNSKIYFAGGYTEDSRGCYVLSDRVYVVD